MGMKDAARECVHDIETFDYSLSSKDHVWNILFPDEREKWHHLHVAKYEDTFYLQLFDVEDPGLEVGPGDRVKQMDSFMPSSGLLFEEDLERLWNARFAALKSWFSAVKKDWIRTNRKVHEQYPLDYRWGIVPNSHIRASLGDVYRIDKELGKKGTRRFVRLVEEGYFFKDENTIRVSMTAADYFDYCRIAYTAGRRKSDHIDESLTGRQMYERYADGRHEGLLDIDEHSHKEFADWIDHTHPKRTMGGHPWEIKRGGNTTHIDLSVSRPLYRNEGFSIELRGAAVTRLVETINMFLALVDAGKPISIANPEGVRKRLLAQDNIGIVPSYNSLHRANQFFGNDEDVYDVMHYGELGRYKRRIRPFITWRPLPVF